MRRRNHCLPRRDFPSHGAIGRCPTKVERLLIPGGVGPLEALLGWNPDVAPQWACLVCHPHPQYGGTMHNKVVFRAAKAALQLGIPALRFNFRGVGKSAGDYAAGVGERADVRAAIDYLQRRYPGLPICLMGFSFGAWVGLHVGASDSRVSVLVGLGVPVATNDFRFLRGVTKPKLLVQGSLDPFGSSDEIQAFYDSLAAPKRLHLVEDADHFFTGKLEEVQEAVREFLEEVLAAHSQPAS
jgi:alpha/beta superfamily hydrolase